MLPYEGVDLEFSLEGKTAVITGGAAGIGYATAKFFHEKGVNIMLRQSVQISGIVRLILIYLHVFLWHRLLADI